MKAFTFTIGTEPTPNVNRDFRNLACMGSMPDMNVGLFFQPLARNALNEPVATWNLSGVVPVRWTGPSLNVDSPKVATETIEIAHHGFLPA